MNQLKVAVIGGLGAMAWPMAIHWKDQPCIKVLRVHDRGSGGSEKENRRQAWRDNGATLVDNFPMLIQGNGSTEEAIDGIFICCGKNGDDLPLLKQVSQLLNPGTFICHLSTVSVAFVEKAAGFCRHAGITYCNYPLTGGPHGAYAANMLILAGGEPNIYASLRDALELIGQPRFFAESVAAGTAVKLMGHLMCFNGLIGICSAAALEAACFRSGAIGGQEQVAFFDFLNQGAGGTNQWGFLKPGLSEGQWQEPFLAKYAAIDLLYALDLAISKGLPKLSLNPMFEVVLAFSYILNTRGQNLATQAIVREMGAEASHGLNEFRDKFWSSDSKECLINCIHSLPDALQGSVALDPEF